MSLKQSLKKRGMLNPMARLTDEQIGEILRMTRAGKTLRGIKASLSRKYSVSPAYITLLSQGKRRGEK